MTVISRQEAIYGDSCRWEGAKDGVYERGLGLRDTGLVPPGAVGQSAVLNCGSEFKENNSLSCRGSTIGNNERELTSTSNETVIVASTASYPVTSTCGNIIDGSEHGEKSQVAIMPVECTAADKGHLDCTSVYCSNEMEAYQPKQRDILEQLSRKERSFSAMRRLFTYLRSSMKLAESINVEDVTKEFILRNFGTFPEHRKFQHWSEHENSSTCRTVGQNGPIITLNTTLVRSIARHLFSAPAYYYQAPLIHGLKMVQAFSQCISTI
ncbi:hypothetical protein EMCRGX_G033783 [Ephydatia muelleri]